MRDIEGDPAFVVSWNEAMKYQRLEKAQESQSIDLELLASMPMHDRLTFERAQAIEEKMAERQRNGAANVYRGWMAEVDPQRRGEKNSSKYSSSTKPKKRRREPSLGRYVCALWCLHLAPTLNALCSSTTEPSYAESSRSVALRKRQISTTWDIAGEGTSTASDGGFSSDGDA
jgi:hypothetical protein